MSIDNLNNNILSDFIGSLQSKDALNSLAKSLVKENLMDTRPQLGSDLKEQMRGSFQVPLPNVYTQSTPKSINIQSLNTVFKETTSDLERIYENRKSRANKTFYLKLVLFGATSALLFVAVGMVFWLESDKKLALATSITGLVTGFFGSTVSKMHKEEDDNLKLIEADMREVSKLDRFFKSISSIQDEAVLKEAYQQLIRQIAI